jgi:hypothetical protein
MSNFVYKKAKEAILNGQINFTTDEIKIILIDSNNYTADENSDEFVSDIDASAIVFTSSTVSNVTNSLGTIDASDLSITLPANKSFDTIIMYQNKTSNENSRLILHIDTAEGLPFSGSSSEISLSILWSNTSTKILSL